MMMFGNILVIITVITVPTYANSFMDDEEAVGIKKKMKYMNNDIINLQKDQDTRFDDKETLKKYQKDIVHMDSVVNDIKINSTLYDFFDENSLENVKKNITLLRDSIESIKDVKENKKKKRLKQECIEELKRKNYRRAVNKAYLINDHNEIEKIVNIAYDGDKNNFNNTRKFGDEIPSISLSLVVYKSLIKEIEKENDKYHLYLDLIESIKFQVYDQIAVDSVTKNEAEDVLYKLKNPVVKWMADKLGKAVMQNRSEKELNDIIERIVYGIKDYQFFRQIADDAAYENFPKDDKTEKYFKNIFNLKISEKQEIPHLIMYQSLFDYIYPNRKSFSKSYQKLLLLRNAMKTANRNERKEFKHISDQMMKNTRDIKINLTKLISHALLERFFNAQSLDDLMLDLVKTDVNFFQDVLKKSVDEIYGKISTVEIIRMMQASDDILELAVNFAVIYDKMKETKEIELKSKNLGALLKLETCVLDTLAMPNMKNVPVHFVSLLKNVESGVKGTKENVSKIFNDGLVKSTYATDDYKTVCLQIYEGERFGFFINTISNKYFSELDSEKLLDYVLSFPRFEERLVGLLVVQRTTKNSVYLFEIAEIYKKFMASEEYDGIQSFFKKDQENGIKMFPSSVRNAVFAKEVYIKNTMEGGEYLYAGFDTDKKNVYTRVSWKIGNNTKWTLEPTRESGVYRIKNVQFDEYLYAGTQFDNKNRQVFLGNKYINGNKWRLMPIDGGLYLKNMMYREYLCAGSLKDKETRFIYTWMTTDERNQGKWKIEDATTDY